MISNAERAQTKIQNFTDLVVWEKGHELALAIYKETKSFPTDERFGLISQMEKCFLCHGKHC
jgi:hypothetical protein